MVDSSSKEKFAAYAVEPKDDSFRAMCLVVGFGKYEDPENTKHTAKDFLECDHYSRLFKGSDGPDKVTGDMAEVESFVLDLAMKNSNGNGNCGVSIDRTSLVFFGRTISYIKAIRRA